MKILIVDDSKAINAMVSQMLKEGGHTSVWAEDGLKAVDILANDKTIDIILLDWNMPKMSGLEFLQKNIKENLTKVPIIMMTTENSTNHIKQSLSLGAAEYIMKPFTKDILLNKFSLLELME